MIGMTLRMTPLLSTSNIVRLAALLALGLASSLLGGCHSDATSYCQRETGLTGEGLKACERGYAELGPQYRDDEACGFRSDDQGVDCDPSYALADAICVKEKEDCIQALNFTGPGQIPLTNTCRNRIPEAIEGGSDKWFDLANGVANRFNGCHLGVRGFYDYVEMYSRPRNSQPRPQGCLMRVDPRGFFVCDE
jgi:hypothetical protein